MIASALLVAVYAAALPAPTPQEDYSKKDYSKAFSNKIETQDREGRAAGGDFVIAFRDGRVQTTTYTADHYNGQRQRFADNPYEEDLVYPPEPAGGYGGDSKPSSYSRPGPYSK